ncbi:uncharacterized protein LOC106645537 [Copidosoma floridanum]|uniref:uncharacterized protein LOC106645537 n=1 Tax=Copidosoma floridanum TaxID=29053 RepID=UPI0006C9D558|nr:uncharacterized protein LOC106645537 [Copidosoma floridanum]
MIVFVYLTPGLLVLALVGCKPMTAKGTITKVLITAAKEKKKVGFAATSWVLPSFAIAAGHPRGITHRKIPVSSHSPDERLEEQRRGSIEAGRACGVRPEQKEPGPGVISAGLVSQPRVSAVMTR